VSEIRAISWVSDGLVLIDQTKLPQQEINLNIETVDQLVDAIKKLAVRGAPALGAAGAWGVVIAMRQAVKENWSNEKRNEEFLRIRNARPTAVNLAWGVDKVLPFVDQGIDEVLAKANQIAAEDEAGNRQMGKFGSSWIESKVKNRPIRALTHCNTGSLATTTWGTALGVIREMNARGILKHVFADETRPLLQGGRLTAWELAHDNIEHFVIADGAATSIIARGEVDVALIGADRVAVALACKYAGIPFVVVAPESTVDVATLTGADIEIEYRDENEILSLNGQRISPAKSKGLNPAFDVTPAELISALVTEKGVYEISNGITPGSKLAKA
jgi:methylthioribose-1-phosphate isomerase